MNCLTLSEYNVMFEDDILKDQFESEGCFKEKDRFANIDFQKAVKERHPKCTNRKTAISRQEIGLFAPTSIVEYVEDGKTYCFLSNELHAIDRSKVNPFTKKPLVGRFDEKVGERNYPLDSIIFRCPVLRSKDPKVVYLYRSEEMKDEKTIDVITKSAEFFQSTIGYMYKIFLKEPFVSTRPVEVDRIELVSKGDVFESEPRPPRKKLLTMGKEALKEFMSVGGKDISPTNIDKIRSQHIYLDKPILLYRGLAFDSEKEATKLFGRTFETGDKYELTDKRVTSWTTNLCLAAYFAAMKVYGVVFVRRVEPSEVLIDTRLLHKKALEELYFEDQAEVMLLSGVRSVQVELVSRVNWNYYD